MNNKTNKNETNLQYGPYLYASHLRAFLGEDQYVTVVVDDKNKWVNVVVSGCSSKAEALERILITDIELEKVSENHYGLDGYKLMVNGKRNSFKTKVTKNDIAIAFAGNHFFKGIETHKIPLPDGNSMNMTFGMLKPEPCEAPCDDIGNPYGLEHFMARDFLKFVLRDKARKVVAWTTDRKQNYE